MTVAFGTHVNFMGNNLLGVGSSDFGSAVLSANGQAIAVTTPVQFDSWDYGTYRSGEYLFQLSQANNYYQFRMLVIHNELDIGLSEGAQVGIGVDIPYTVDASFSAGNLELTLACPTAHLNPVYMKFSRVLFDV